MNCKGFTKIPWQKAFKKNLFFIVDRKVLLNFAPLTNSDIERSFSLYRHILSNKRLNLKPKNVAKLNFVNLNAQKLNRWITLFFKHSRFDFVVLIINQWVGIFKFLTIFNIFLESLVMTKMMKFLNICCNKLLKLKIWFFINIW